MKIKETYPAPPKTTLSTRPPCLFCGHPLIQEVREHTFIQCLVCGTDNRLSPDWSRVINATIFPSQVNLPFTQENVEAIRGFWRSTP